MMENIHEENSNSIFISQLKKAAVFVSLVSSSRITQKSKITNG